MLKGPCEPAPGAQAALWGRGPGGVLPACRVPPARLTVTAGSLNFCAEKELVSGPRVAHGPPPGELQPRRVTLQGRVGGLWDVFWPGDARVPFPQQGWEIGRLPSASGALLREPVDSWGWEDAFGG